jgi:hypothetical protein
MKCPVCGKEYRAGVLRCRKCAVLLVESAPASSTTATSAQDQRVPMLLWSGQDPVLFSALTHELVGAAIPFYESAVHDPSAGLFASFPLRSEALGGLEIRVAGCDLTAAQEILAAVVGTIGTLAPSEADEAGADDDDAADHDRGDASSDTRDWQPADATAELWNGDDESWAGYLIDVLWENGVRAKAMQDTVAALQRVLVRPADYARAQRVLLLLEEASSPE